MNRQAWLSDRLMQVERWYAASAATYDAREPSSPAHEAFLAQVIASVEVGGTILDAPCGTGRYFDRILNAGRQVVGIDASNGMLDVARTRYPEIRLERGTLQHLAFRRAFDAAVCIDSLEYVPPEDWPGVLDNLREAVRAGGLIYLTVEEIDHADLDRAAAQARFAGLPVVAGEHADRGGGYHFYPTRDVVAAWLEGARLEVVADGTSAGANYAYWHLLVREAPEEDGRPETPYRRTEPVPRRFKAVARPADQVPRGR